MVNNPTDKAQGPLWKKGQKNCKEKDEGILHQIVSSSNFRSHTFKFSLM